MTKKLITLIFFFSTATFSITVDEILDKMEENENANTSRMEMTQIVVKADGRKNTSKLISYSIDKGDKGLMEYSSPARIKGMKILMLNDGDDIWFYSPRTARVRKIASHQKNQSVNNSDFSYEDLSTEDRREDYACKLLGEEKIDSCLSSILGSNPSRALVDAAENEKFDLIVVGSRGLGSAASFILGSVSKQVVSKANCDVLVVKK